MQGTVVVVGGAGLDIRLRLTGPAVPGTSNRGQVASMPGGVGRNIAENLARLGRPTTLVAAVGDDLAGRTVVAATEAAGVDCRHLIASPHPTGTYAALLDEAGELALAVADMRASDELTVADLAGVPALLAPAGALVADANLGPEVLAWLLAAAAEAGVVTVLEPVSVAKAAAAGPALGPATPVHTVTPNLDELAALTGHPVHYQPGDQRSAAPDRPGGTPAGPVDGPLGTAAGPGDGPVGTAAGPGDRRFDGVREAARCLHERGVGHVWVRLGAEGSLLSSAPGAGARAADGGPRVWRIGAPAVAVVDVTGAGDAMTAGYLHALLGGAGVVEAARYGQALAALTCASPHTVRPDLSPALVAAHLTPTEPTAVELT